jgi:hypothetical protein
MIASCWDWPSLKYSYFVLEDQPLDAGGWSPTKGIVSKSQASSGNKSVCLEDCLPTLPENSYFAGVGDFCVGELYEKRDQNPRPKIDLNRMLLEGTPQEVKVVELITDSKNTQLRNNPSTLGESNSNDVQYSYRVEDKSVFQKLVPTIAGLGTGFLFYQTFQKFTKSNLELRDVILSWSAGLAIGVTIGQEAAKHDLLSGNLKNKKGSK